MILDGRSNSFHQKTTCLKSNQTLLNSWDKSSLHYDCFYKCSYITPEHYLYFEMILNVNKYKTKFSKLVKLSHQLDLILLNVDSLADAHHLLPQGDHLGLGLKSIYTISETKSPCPAALVFPPSPLSMSCQSTCGPAERVLWNICTNVKYILLKLS